jgi:adenosylmethionine-8-amino-7-oxononanoate aminotransferase
VTRFWHPVADMYAVSQSGELVLDRGEGVWIWDEEGRRYLDACASLWYCNVGYGRAEIADAAAAQLRRLPAYSAYGDLSTRPTTNLAGRVARLAPFDDAVVFFTSGGAESVETAAKMARRYWTLQGEPERTVIISRERAYHGMAGFGTSIVGMDPFKVGLGPLVPDTVRVPWNSIEALEQAIGELGAERVAAFFCEPVIGAGGVLAPPEGYVDAVKRICRECGALLVADEVICGYGRVGSWFASTRFGLEPDLVTFAKGITSGYVPLGASSSRRASRSRSGAPRRPGSGGMDTRIRVMRSRPRPRTRTSTSSSARGSSSAASRWSRSSPRPWRLWLHTRL